jgi:hypothetical protein
VSKVNSVVAAALFRKLSGFPGYPKSEQGEAHYIEAFQDASISVDHARAIIAVFDERMPTLREIRDAALNLRPRFEPQIDQRTEWEKQYGKPDPNWSKNLIGSHAQQRARMLWQSIRDAVYYAEGPGKSRLAAIQDWKQRHADIEFWTGRMVRTCKNHAAELLVFRQELAARGWDELMKEDWANEAQAVAAIEPAKPFKRITQADIDAVKASRETSTSVAEPEDEPEAEDDPDRWE